MENIFKQASKLKLRFQTTKGILSTEQLWDLSLADLDTLAVSLEEAVTKSKSKSFLVKQTTENETVKLQFDVVLNVLKTKSEELEQIKSAREIKAHNAKILSLIAEKQEEGLKSKSVEDLEKLLK